MNSRLKFPEKSNLIVCLKNDGYMLSIYFFDLTVTDVTDCYIILVNAGYCYIVTGLLVQQVCDR